MEYDPTGTEELEWALWFKVMCLCDHCEAWLDVGDIELLDRDPMEWAKSVAPEVKALGWSAPSEFELLCPKCTAAKGVSQ